MERFWELNIWIRVGLLGLVGACVVAAFFLSVAQFPQEAIGFFGTWLLLYRLLIRSRWGPIVQIMTSAISGASVVLLAPLLAWPPVAYRFPLLALLGGLFAACSFRLSLAMACTCIGIAAAALLWQLGLCTVVPISHSCMLACGAGLLVSVFSCTPLGTLSLERVLFPVLGALLVVESAGAWIGTLAHGPLLEASECPAENLSKPACTTGVAWLVLALIGMVFQWFMLKASDEEDSEGEKKDGLAEGLLPASAATTGGGLEGVIKDKNAGIERQPVLCTAIFAPEGADQSHLTAHEKKIVAICRKDEFERDRVLWGGGLL